MRRHRKHSLKGRLGGHTLVRHEVHSCRLTAMASGRTARMAEEQARQGRRLRAPWAPRHLAGERAARSLGGGGRGWVGWHHGAARERWFRAGGRWSAVARWEAPGSRRRLAGERAARSPRGGRVGDGGWHPPRRAVNAGLRARRSRRLPSAESPSWATSSPGWQARSAKPGGWDSSPFSKRIFASAAMGRRGCRL